MQKGLLKEAINAFSKASFFVPEKPHPFVAAAECYVSLCDFQGAVKQYRRALWLLRARDEHSRHDSAHDFCIKFDMTLNRPSSGADDMSLGDRNCSDDGGGDNDLFRNSNHERCSSSGPPTLRGEKAMSAAVFRPTSAADARGQCGGSGSVAASSCGHPVANADQILADAVEARLAGILDALSIVLYNTGDYAQALRFAEDSLELRQHPQVNIHRCAYLVALEREDEAEKALEKHLREHPCHHVEATSMLVHLYSLRQAFRHAKDLLENVPGNQRKHPQILLSQHIFDNAYSAFRKRSIATSDVQGLTRCLTVFPEDATLLFERAKYYVEKGMDKKAIHDLFYCLKNLDGNDNGALELMTKTLFNHAASLDGQNGIKDAIEYYTTSLLWDADNIPVLLARGDCYAKLEDYQKALRDFFRVDNISRDPEAQRRIAFLHDVWGTKFYNQGKLEEAEREFSKAIATCDAEPLFYYHRARCRFDMNEPRYALRDVLSCRHLNPQSATIRDFVNAHIGCMTLESEKKPPVKVKLPVVQTSTFCRAAALYGGDKAKMARKLHNQHHRFQVVREKEGDFVMDLSTKNGYASLDGVLRLSKANIHRNVSKPKNAGHDVQ